MFWQIIVLVVASNLDDLGVGFSLGIKGKIPWRVIWIISILSGVTMAAGLLIGDELAEYIPGNWAIYIASLVLAGIGIWLIWQGFKVPEADDPNPTASKIGWKAAIILGLALGIDSFAAGFSGGLTDFPIIVTSVLAWLTSLVFVWLGSTFAGKVSVKVVRDYAEFFSGACFILLAVVVLFFKDV